MKWAKEVELVSAGRCAGVRCGLLSGCPFCPDGQFPLHLHCPDMISSHEMPRGRLGGNPLFQCIPAPAPGPTLPHSPIPTASVDSDAQRPQWTRNGGSGALRLVFPRQGCPAGLGPLVLLRTALKAGGPPPTASDEPSAAGAH